MDFSDLTDLFSGNDVFYVSWSNEMADPRRLQNAFVHFHAKDVCVSVPLTDEYAPALVTFVAACLEQKSSLMFSYDIKDMIVAMRSCLTRQGWKPKVEWAAKIFDLCYLERYAGLEGAPPQNLSEAKSRFKKHDKSLFSIHRDIHIPLATRTIPRIEGVPLLKVGEGHLFSHYQIEGTTYGRLNCDKPGHNYCTPLNLTKDDQILPSKEGHVLLSVDYHAMEVAVLQKVSGDRRLEKILQQPDVYEAIGRYLFECSKEEAKASRNLVKAIFLPIMYGMAPPGIAKKLSVSYEFAEKVFNEVHAKFPQASGFMVDVEREADGGSYTDCLGRKRAYDKGEGRAARNGSVSGPAAMHCQSKLIELSDALEGVADIAVAVHDGYWIACHRYQMDEVARMTRSILESESGVLPGLKLRTRAATGQTLGSMEKYEYRD